MVEGGNAGKRINVCIASTLPDWESNGWMMVEFYVNGQFVHFLVCGRPNLALTRRYSRIFTGAIFALAPIWIFASLFQGLIFFSSKVLLFLQHFELRASTWPSKQLQRHRRRRRSRHRPHGIASLQCSKHLLSNQKSRSTSTHPSR